MNIDVSVALAIVELNEQGLERPRARGDDRRELSALLATIRRGLDAPILPLILRGTERYAVITLDRDRSVLVCTTVRPRAERLADSLVAVPLDDRTFPGFVGTPVTLLPGTASPGYPTDSPTAQGALWAEFFVRADGSADRSSIRIMRSDDKLFAARVRSWISTGRFLPSTIGGCAVPALVREYFRFRREG